MILGVGALTDSRWCCSTWSCNAVVSGTNCKLLVLHNAASRVGAMDVGANNPKGISDLINYDVIFNLGSDEMEIPNGPFVIYQGSHGDRGAHRADIILPLPLTQKKVVYL